MDKTTRKTAEVSSSDTVVGSSFVKSHRKIAWRRWIALGAVIVIVGTCLVLVLANTVFAKPVFTIEGKKYSKAAVEKLIKDSNSSIQLSDEQVAQQAFNYYKEQQAAKDLNLMPAQSQIDEEKKTLPGAGKQGKDNAWLDLLAFHNALPDYFASLKNGIYTGYSFVFNFSGRIIPQDPEVPTPGWGDLQLIAKDQVYAKGQADNYHDQVASGKISAQSLFDKIKKDPTLGLKDNTISFDAWHSARFDSATDSYWQGVVANQSIATYISLQSKPGLSKVQVANVSTTSSAAAIKNYAPGEYYFVQLDSIKKAVPDAQKQVENRVKTMEAHYYGL